MNVRLFGQFLRDRIGLIVAFLAHTGLLLALITLILRGSDAPEAAVRPNVLYALLLSLAVIVVYMIVDFVRWWPFARRAGQLLGSDTDPAGLLSLPPGGNVDQRIARDLLTKFHRLSTDELLRSEAARRRHLDFINLWVHQMKTPVSAINVIAQQTEAEAGGSGAGAADAMRSIEEESAKLADGLDLVLNMARLEDFALDFHITSVDLLAAVRVAINARKKVFIRHSMYPEVEAEPGPYVVLTDAKWHRFVLDQLIANALKYGAQGGSPGQRLRFRLSRNDDTITLAVADEGPGIPPEDVPRVFDAFFTGQNGRCFANATGIGLYLVRQVTDKLGHQISVASELGQGTTVTLHYDDTKQKQAH